MSAVTLAIRNLVAENDLPLTVTAVTEQSGISRPTFYKYFPTIGSAVLHTHFGVLAELAELLEAHGSIDPASTGRTKLFEQVHRVHSVLRSRPDIISFFSFFDFNFRRWGLSAVERAEHASVWAHGEFAFFAYFEAGRADGSIRSDLSPDVTVQSLLSSTLGLLQRMQIQDEWTAGVADDRADAMFDALVSAWKALVTPR